MPIQYNSSMIKVTPSVLFGDATTNAETLGAFWDASLKRLYVALHSGGSKWLRKIDYSNPLFPAGSNWAVSDASFIDASGAVFDGNLSMFTVDHAAGYAYTFRNVGNGATTYYNLVRISLINDIVEYSNLASPVEYKQIVSVVTRNEFMYMVVIDAYDNTFFLKFDFSSATWDTITGVTIPWVNVSSNIPFYYTQNSINAVVGMSIDTNGDIILYYDVVNIAEKYDGNDLSFKGVTSFSNSDTAIVFSGAGIIFKIKNAVNNAGGGLTLLRYVDYSTETVSTTKSIFSYSDRTIYVGEPSVVTLHFKAYDDFGLEMNTLIGANVKFEILTGRGTLDANDSALSTSSDPASFRNYSNIPLHRAVTVPLDINGEATCYFQSARTTASVLIQDLVRVRFPG